MAALARHSTRHPAPVSGCMVCDATYEWAQANDRFRQVLMEWAGKQIGPVEVSSTSTGPDGGPFAGKPEGYAREVVLSMAAAIAELAAEEPMTDDQIGGYLVGTMGDRTAEQKLFMMSCTFGVALRLINQLTMATVETAVQELNTPPTEKENP